MSVQLSPQREMGVGLGSAGAWRLHPSALGNDQKGEPSSQVWLTEATNGELFFGRAAAAFAPSLKRRSPCSFRNINKYLLIQRNDGWHVL